MQQVRSFTSSVLEPSDRGVEFGQHHRDEIARTVAAYRRLFAAYAAGSFGLDLWAEKAWLRIRELAPVAADEIAGIAEGAEVPIREIAALNARTELLAIANPAGVPECSTVVSLPVGEVPVAVQTWDWYDAMAADWLHWTIPYPDGRVVSTVTEYGVLAKIGVNSHGVGVLLNMLHHVDDENHDLGFPVHLLSRQILETATSLAEGVATARSVTTSASTALTIVGVAGDACSVELFPGGSGTLAPEDSLLARTNHFVSVEGRAGCLASTIGPGSRLRRSKILAAFSGDLPRSAEKVLAVMNDHADVGGICAHPDRGMERVLQHATLATVVVDTGERSLRVHAGGPCKVRPEE